MALDILLREKNTEEKSLSFFGPKVGSKINPSIKITKTSSLKEIFYLIFKDKLIQISYHIVMTDIII